MMQLTRILALFIVFVSHFCPNSYSSYDDFKEDTGITFSSAQQLLDEYPLVRDHRNFKESAGGKGVPPQGRVLKDLMQSFFINENMLEDEWPQDHEFPWKYIVMLNCKMNSRSTSEIFTEITTKLIPEVELRRLGVIIGINEKLLLNHPLNHQPNFKQVVGCTEDEIKAFNIPVLILYVPWVEFRESKK